MIPLFLDCDPGIDDAVAISYLLCQEDVDVVGIAATGGNVPTGQTVRNALGWLELAGRRDIPVHPGAEVPLKQLQEGGLPLYADDTHGPQGAGHAQLPEPQTAASPIPSAEAWVQAARAHPGELIGVLTGPSTNLALALRQEPELPRLIKRLFVMGGAFNYRGNTKPTTEWNIDHDPEAAREVFAAFGVAEHLPLIGPIEATEAVVMTPDRLSRTLSGAPRDQWHQLLEQLGEALRFYFEFHEFDGHGYLAQIHDPFVLAVALEWARGRRPGSLPWCETAVTAVDVETTGTLTRGETVADWLGRWGRQPNAELIRRVDAESFLNHLETTLMRGPEYVRTR